MASWNLIPLEITYEVLGWIAFVSSTVGPYPQLILNFRRKSVVGLNLTKHSSYLIYNATLYFSKAVQKQYFEKYGFGEMIPVAANDVAFSSHVVLITAITLIQIAIYEHGGQTVSKISFAIVYVVWLVAGVCFFIALPTHSWLWLINIFNSIQVFMIAIKYIPQAFMNFKQKSTNGFNIGNILLDFSGGVANYAQLAVQSIDQGLQSFLKPNNSWVNFYGNIGKMLMSLISILFDIIFMVQHFLLYSSRRTLIPSKTSKESEEPLVKSTDESENV